MNDQTLVAARSKGPGLAEFKGVFEKKKKTLQESLQLDYELASTAYEP